MADVYVQDISGELLYTYDFSAEVPTGVTVTAITVTSAPTLDLYTSSDDFANGRKTVGLRGFAHAQLYNIKALASLDSGEKLTKAITVRGLAGD